LSRFGDMHAGTAPTAFLGPHGLTVDSRGDLYVELKVQTPTKLSKQQRDLLQELQGTLSVENKPVSRTLLGKMRDIFN